MHPDDLFQTRPVSKFRMRSDTFFLAMKGLTHQSPGTLTVPTYLPNSVRTRPSFGLTTNSPPRQSSARATQHEPRDGVERQVLAAFRPMTNRPKAMAARRTTRARRPFTA